MDGGGAEMGLLLPFGLAACLKLAQGSSTVAISLTVNRAAAAAAAALLLLGVGRLGSTITMVDSTATMARHPCLSWCLVFQIG